MKGQYYNRALVLADDDPDLLDDIHDILIKDGLSEDSYAQVFALLYFKSQEPSKQISCSSAGGIWKRGRQVLSDIKLFAALNDCCDLIRCYSLASWENCVFSAWATSKEVAKAEKAMDAMETLAHAKAILALAAPIMENAENESTINWSDQEESGDTNEP